MGLVGKKEFHGQYPNMLEFQKPWECAIRVSQGYAKCSFEGKPLQSEGFGECVGLILRDITSLDSMLFHIDTLDIEPGNQTIALCEFMLHYIDKQDSSFEEKLEIKKTVPEICKYWNPENMTRKEFTKKMIILNNNKIKGCFLYREDGRGFIKKNIEEDILNYFNISCSEIALDSGDLRFDVVYDPKISKLFIAVNKTHELLEYIF